MATAGAGRTPSALKGVVLVESDVNGDILPAWSYPSVAPELEEALVAKSTPFISKSVVEASSSQRSTSVFSRFGSQWLYTVALPAAPDDSPKVVGFSVTVVTTTFNPESWSQLAELLTKQYFLTGEPTALLESFLAAFSVGKIRGSELLWDGSAHSTRDAMVTGTSLMAVLKVFGVDTVLLWTALMLKKRVIVYCNRLKDLQPLMRTLPQLVWHRQDWNILRPWVAGSPAEFIDISKSAVYVAGVTDPSFRSRQDLYDLYVDVPSQSMHIAESAKADFEMGGPHREVANAITELLGASGVAEDMAVKALMVKTKGLVAKLKSLPSPLTQATLAGEALRLSVSVQRFLYGVALAEPSIATA